MADQPKVFCIGFHKTGTTSLYSALTTLGYRVTGTVLHKWTAERLEQEGAQRLIEIMKDFDAAEDMPWPHFYRQLRRCLPRFEIYFVGSRPRQMVSFNRQPFRSSGNRTQCIRLWPRPCTRQWRQGRIGSKPILDHNDEVRSYFRQQAG